MTGSLRAEDSIAVQTGWNLIGSISLPVATTNIASDPPGMLTSNFYGYKGGYYITNTMQPSKGYWVKVNQGGKLILSSSSIMRAMNNIRIVPSTELPPIPPGELSSNNPTIPGYFYLEQNYPNPFNPTCIIRYQLPVESYVTLKIYTMLGQEVVTLVNEVQTAGYKSVEFDARKFPSGVYVYRLTAGTFSDTKKMLLLK